MSIKRTPNASFATDRRLLCVVLAGLIGSVSGVAQSAPPRIVLCQGTRLITAVNDATGDYESIKTIVAVDQTQMVIRYTAQKMDYGGLFSVDPPKLRQYATRRIVRQEDMRTSRAYLQEFSTEIPEAVPGMTALGTSAAVLAELKKTGEAEFGISHWAFAVPPNLDPEDSQSIYRKQMKARSKVVDRPALSVLVNGVPAQLPTVHVQGNFLGYQSEFWFLDQSDNPLTLRFRIGVNELAKLSDADKANCARETKLLGYLPQMCTHPDGGDRATLELVKIDSRCEAGAMPTGGGAGGSPAASGGGQPTGGSTASGTATGGAIPALDASKLERSLASEGRVEIPDIYFSFNSAEIREESATRLDEVAEILKRHPDWKIKIEGHTDSLAADDYNLKLSQSRAASVMKALVSRSIAASRLRTEGLGETRPRASNDSLTGRARNRRVELVLDR